ncbi:MAG TPA: hypothetical protein VF409_05835 [Sphingomonas sp.]
MLIVVLALQSAAPAGTPIPIPGDDVDRFDLAKANSATSRTACGGSNPGDDIVVCARRKTLDIDTSRMPAFTEKPVRTIVDLPGGAKAGVGT